MLNSNIKIDARAQDAGIAAGLAAGTVGGAAVAAIVSVQFSAEALRVSNLFPSPSNLGEVIARLIGRHIMAPLWGGVIGRIAIPVYVGGYFACLAFHIADKLVSERVAAHNAQPPLLVQYPQRKRTSEVDSLNAEADRFLKRGIDVSRSLAVDDINEASSDRKRARRK